MAQTLHYFRRTCQNHGSAVYKAWYPDNLTLAGTWSRAKAKLKDNGLGCCKLTLIEKTDFDVAARITSDGTMYVLPNRNRSKDVTKP
jgi:hypothetical protein